MFRIILHISSHRRPLRERPIIPFMRVLGPLQAHLRPIHVRHDAGRTAQRAHRRAAPIRGRCVAFVAHKRVAIVDEFRQTALPGHIEDGMVQWGLPCCNEIGRDNCEACILEVGNECEKCGKSWANIDNTFTFKIHLTFISLLVPTIS